jgi:hypothetical protein
MEKRGRPIGPARGEVERMTTERQIAWVERIGIGLSVTAGLAGWLAAPAVRVAMTRPMLLVAGGVTLLAVGLVRDLARLALEQRERAPKPARHPPGDLPGEVRLCLESTIGLAAVTAGLAWWLTSPGAVLAPSLGALVLVLAAVAALGHVTRNLVVAVRREPAHRNVVFWS